MYSSQPAIYVREQWKFTTAFSRNTPTVQLLLLNLQNEVHVVKKNRVGPKMSKQCLPQEISTSTLLIQWTVKCRTAEMTHFN